MVISTVCLTQVLYFTYQQKYQFKENLDYERWLTLVLTGVFVTNLQQCHISGGTWLKRDSSGQNTETMPPGIHLILGILKPHICQGAASSWRLRPCSVLPCRRNQDRPADVQQPGQISFRDQMFMRNEAFTCWRHLGRLRSIAGRRV